MAIPILAMLTACAVSEREIVDSRPQLTGGTAGEDPGDGGTGGDPSSYGGSAGSSAAGAAGASGSETGGSAGASTGGAAGEGGAAGSSGDAGAAGAAGAGATGGTSGDGGTGGSGGTDATGGVGGSGSGGFGGLNYVPTFSTDLMAQTLVANCGVLGDQKLHGSYVAHYANKTLKADNYATVKKSTLTLTKDGKSMSYSLSVTPTGSGQLKIGETKDVIHDLTSAFAYAVLGGDGTNPCNYCGGKLELVVDWQVGTSTTTKTDTFGPVTFKCAAPTL
jgi:hypothetical protein